MKKLYHRLQQAFGFSQRETNGFLILSALMLLFVAGMYWVPALWNSAPYVPAADKKQLDSLVALLDTTSYDSAFTNSSQSPEKHYPAVKQNLFFFDPNKISAQQWQELGTPRFLAERIIRYRSKGGSFRVKSDLKKIYDFPETLYIQLYPYIQLPENPGNTNSISQTGKTPVAVTAVASEKRTFDKPSRFNLNTADSNQLKAIRGIGSGLSRRILKYRDALGGFVNANQVREVYGLDSSVVDELLKYGYVPETDTGKKLRINSATAEELDAHPYITPRLAKIMVAYRQQHGAYRSVADLANIKILDQTTLQKITPYLSFD